MEAELKQDYSYYLEKALSGLANVLEIQKDYPDVPIVSGEGVSYIGSKKLLWEEYSEVYWDLLKRSLENTRKQVCGELLSEPAADRRILPGIWYRKNCCESTKLFWKDKIINFALNTCLCFPAM